MLDQDLANNGAFGVEPAVRDADGNIIREGSNVNSELGILIQSSLNAQVMENMQQNGAVVSTQFQYTLLSLSCWQSRRLLRMGSPSKQPTRKMMRGHFSVEPPTAG